MRSKRTALLILALCLLIALIVGGQQPNIPGLLFHQVHPHMRVSPAEFEKLLIWLKKERYEPIFVWELPKYSVEKPPTRKRIMLTFDDGYSDCYTAVFPLLKKYKTKATIFVITSKVSDISSGGYLSWSQIREMIASGFVDIQSHSSFHNYCYVSNIIEDFNSPNNWSMVYSPDGDRRIGIPIYEHKSALVSRCYIDDYQLRDYLAGYSQQNESTLSNLSSSARRTALSSAARVYIAQHPFDGRYESMEEYDIRVLRDLLLSKNRIEEETHRRCNVISWPFGQYDERSVALAVRTGYNVCVTADKGTNYLGRIDITKVRRVEGVEYGLEKVLLGWLPLSNSLAVRVVVYNNWVFSVAYLSTEAFYKTIRSRLIN